MVERAGGNVLDRRLVRGIEIEIGRRLQGAEGGAADAGAMTMMILGGDLGHGISLLRHRRVGLVVMTIMEEDGILDREVRHRHDLQPLVPVNWTLLLSCEMIRIGITTIRRVRLINLGGT